MSDLDTPPPERTPGSPLADEVIATVVPEASGLERGARNRRIVVSLVCGAVLTVLGVLASRGTDWFFAEHDARVASEADDKADREGQAFTATVRLDAEDPEATLFDTPFSAEDKRTLLGMTLDDLGRLQPFMDAHHGRGASYSAVRHSAMKVSYPGYSETWLVDLLSDRQAGLVINDLRVKDLSCTPAKAVAAIEIQGQGGGGYEGMLFDLTRTDPVPLTTAEEDFGKPFFAHRKIDLGNGATPGGLRIEVTSGTKDCTWKAFEATYVDSEGTHTQEITNNGKTFTVHGIAAHRAQTFQVRATVPMVSECAASPRVGPDC
ncbi:hypothetical protein HLK59_33515 [Streptomyces sp. S3(2020)]|uniref:hypothetical protein n=1 Tax=Streptomyces sp. S3(2020) TaxID=2732044 RepID=UPI0014884C11|nr:hypothetical protein [Streptomyces sp. S3(2020)]NNN35199.1 hypothetical protein [Streptomyces sp. S3(2020)]